MTADIGYSVLTGYLSFDQGDQLDSLWLLCYVLWGAAAVGTVMALILTMVMVRISSLLRPADVPCNETVTTRRDLSDAGRGLRGMT